MKMYIRFSRENKHVRLTAVWKYVFRLLTFAVSLSLTLIIIFILMSIFYTCSGWTVSYDRLSSISLLRYVLANFRFFQITSDYLISCFPWSSCENTTANLEGSTFTRPITRLSSIHSRLSLWCSLLSCNLKFISSSVVLSSFAEILSSDVAHASNSPCIIALYSLLSFCSLTGQVSVPYSITLLTHVEYLSFAPKEKPPVANKGTKSLNLDHPLLILVITLDNRTFPQFQEIGHLILCMSDIKLIVPFQFTSSSTTSVKLLTPVKLIRMELMPTHFLQTTQGNLPSIVTFQHFQ